MDFMYMYVYIHIYSIWYTTNVHNGEVYHNPYANVCFNIWFVYLVLFVLFSDYNNTPIPNPWFIIHIQIHRMYPTVNFISNHNWHHVIHLTGPVHENPTLADEPFTCWNVSQHWDDAGGRNPSSVKTVTRLVNILAADYLETEDDSIGLFSSRVMRSQHRKR